MDRTLVLEYTRVTEAAAIAASNMIGRGDRNGADAAAVKAMRDAFERVSARGTIVIGEGERDEAPMLFIGERVGPVDPKLPEVDIAVDPLEGTNLCANGLPGAITVLAVSDRGLLLNAPDCYMMKIACGPEGRGKLSLDKSPRDNLWALAAAKGRRPDELTVVVLDRPRHNDLVTELREAGARIHLITDGDVAPVVATCIPKSGIDMVYGIGGAPEGVLGAAAIHCMGGEFLGKLVFRSDSERERAVAMGHTEPDRLFRVNDLVRGDMQALMNRKDLSKSDRDRLQLHFDAIRDLEINMSCNLTDMEIAAMEAIQPEVANSDNVETISRMQMDIVALAFACGAVRTATLQVGDGNDSTEYTINGQKQYSYHWISHRIQGDGDTGAPIENAYLLHHEIDKIHGNLFKYLLDKLDSYTLGAGTLLDAGVAVWTNDLADKYHSYNNVPYVMAGGLNGYLKTGVYVDAGDVYNNKLFNTIGAGMGLTNGSGQPLDDFGDASLEKGHIDVIKA